MKKLTLVLGMVAAVVLLAMVASAQTVLYTVDTNGAFDVTYEGATEGAYYAIVAIQGIASEGTAPTITEDSIQYIDQKTAAGSTVTFEDILLKVDGTPSTVYLGGSDLDAAVLLGYVNKPAEEEDTYTITGTVTSASSKEATITFTPASGDPIVVTTDAAGAYSANVPAGTYKFEVVKAAHLSYTKNEFVVSGNDTKDVTLLGGDVDGNSTVNISDLNVVLTNFGTDDEDSDIDGNVTINIGDLNIVLTNFSETAVVE